MKSVSPIFDSFTALIHPDKYPDSCDLNKRSWRFEKMLLSRSKQDFFSESD